MSSGFPRAARLTQRAEFDYVFSAPDQKSSDRYFTVLGRCRVCARTHSRIGLVVAKKRIARAHERNRIKRIVRESFRQYDFSAYPADFVILAKPAAQEADNASLFSALDRHWRRITS